MTEDGGDGHGAGSGSDEPPRRDDEGFGGVGDLIGTFLREPSLWPVSAVALASGGAFTAALIVLAAVDRNPFAALALVLVLGMTIDLAWRARRDAAYRSGALLVGLIWAVGLAFTALAVWTGIAFGS